MHLTLTEHLWLNPPNVTTRRETYRERAKQAESRTVSAEKTSTETQGDELTLH